MTQDTATESGPDTEFRRMVPSEAEGLYFVREWGGGFFGVNDAGHAVVRPILGSDLEIDVYAVAKQLRDRGTHLPLLLRFQDLLQTRVRQLNEAFLKAIGEAGYRNDYRGVYPIKVNQLREVVEEILDAGMPYKFGLECGSKAELIATLAYAAEDTLLICNGCKDAVMMRLMLEGQGLDREILPVLERYDEFELFLGLLPEFDVQGEFGVRVRLSTSGAGLWSESGGENSKFGLSLTEVLQLIDRLESHDAPPLFRLLHFHLGSQIADLGNVRQAVREAGRIYASLRRRGMDIEYLDVGGGLGVSYEAGNPDVAGYINYGILDYARAVVEELGRVCDEEGVPHPVIVSESGRAVTAFHSVLVVEVLDQRSKALLDIREQVNGGAPLPELAALLQDLRYPSDEVNLEWLEAAYRRAESLRLAGAEALRSGQLSLEEKSQVDRAFWTICQAISDRFDSLPASNASDALRTMLGFLPDHYLCNFSVFRSVVDHWAIGQRFPIMPIHRLNESPNRRGILVDLTCDSDGEISSFVAPSGDKRHLELHDKTDGEPYLLGIFLMGAYQDIMGDMHNLFGRVTEAHIYGDADEPENFYVEKILDGSTIEEQLALVQYFPNDLERRVNETIFSRVRSGELKPKEAALLVEQYRQAFREYTYLNVDPSSGKKNPVRGSRIRQAN